MTFIKKLKPRYLFKQGIDLWHLELHKTFSFLWVSTFVLRRNKKTENDSILIDIFYERQYFLFCELSVSPLQDALLFDHIPN